MMNRSKFQTYRDDSIKRFTKILNSRESGFFDDQGLPAYTNPNFMMRWLTWKRVDVILSAISRYIPLDNVLDFGCGYGVFIPYLTEQAKNIFAYDLIIEEVKKMGQEYGWKNVHYVSSLAEINSKPQSLDLILAIEVLEHIDNLDETVDFFVKNLLPNGHLLVAGPTENLLYKIGRKLAGYSGEYHKSNIYRIHDALRKQFNIQKVATILPLLPFYQVYDCTPLKKLEGS
jgi:2-polyprenyl-3-methyl-5-hydroxy-6-metoxy-1,4-benzoquinol methylase